MPGEDLVIPYVDRQCTEKKCEPFFIREWETMLVGTLITVAVIYLMCSCSGGSSWFDAASGSVPAPTYIAPPQYNIPTYDRRSSQQAHYTVDDRAGHDGARTDMFAAMPKLAKAPGLKIPGTINQGKKWKSTGPAVSKFMDFYAIDAIDSLEHTKPIPTYMPETTDDDLETIIR